MRAEYLSKLQENKFAIKLTNGFPLIIMNETDKINYIEYVIRYKGDDISLLLTFAAHFFTLGSEYWVVQEIGAFKELNEAAIGMPKKRFLKEFCKF